MLPPCGLPTTDWSGLVGGGVRSGSAAASSAVVESMRARGGSVAESVSARGGLEIGEVASREDPGGSK